MCLENSYTFYEGSTLQVWQLYKLSPSITRHFCLKCSEIPWLFSGTAVCPLQKVWPQITLTLKVHTHSGWWEVGRSSSRAVHEPAAVSRRERGAERSAQTPVDKARRRYGAPADGCWAGLLRGLSEEPTIETREGEACPTRSEQRLRGRPRAYYPSVSRQQARRALPLPDPSLRPRLAEAEHCSARYAHTQDGPPSFSRICAASGRPMSLSVERRSAMEVGSLERDSHSVRITSVGLDFVAK